MRERGGWISSPRPRTLIPRHTVSLLSLFGCFLCFTVSLSTPLRAVSLLRGICAMTLLDAPAFDEARDRRNRALLYSAVGLFVALFIGGWLISGYAADWPWNWWTHLRGRHDCQPFPRCRRARRPTKSLRHLDARPRLAAAPREVDITIPFSIASRRIGARTALKMNTA